MLDIIFWILIGVLVGWNLPQPLWAAYVQNKIVSWIKTTFAEKTP